MYIKNHQIFWPRNGSVEKMPNTQRERNSKSCLVNAVCNLGGNLVQIITAPERGSFWGDCHHTTQQKLLRNAQANSCFLFWVTSKQKILKKSCLFFTNLCSWVLSDCSVSFGEIKKEKEKCLGQILCEAVGSCGFLVPTGQPHSVWILVL